MKIVSINVGMPRETVWKDMVVCTGIFKEPVDGQRRRASDLGASLTEYFRRLVARDLARPEAGADVDRIFDLGNRRFRHCERQGCDDC